MYRLKNILRLMMVLAIVPVIGAAPYLQDRQLNDLGDTCSKSCCCGCSCGQDESSASEAVALKSSCCCSVSAPAIKTEVLLEAQPRPTTNPDIFTAVMSATSHITVVRTEPHQTARTSQRLAHGPPLYVLNTSFLI